MSPNTDRTVSRLRVILHLWFGFTAPVSRQAYVVSGLFLASAKLAGDFALARAGGQGTWTPATALTPLYEVRFDGLMPSWITWIALWSIPFVWIGASMTWRRAQRSGLSPAWALLFFVPFVNYLLILVLALRPAQTSSGVSPAEASFRSPESTSVSRTRTPVVAVVGGVVTGFVLLGFSILVSSKVPFYSWPLFVGTPFVAGFVTGYLAPRDRGSGLLVQLMVLILGGAILLQGLEGVLCLAMVWPLAATIAWVGGGFGGVVRNSRRSAAPQALSLVLLAPVLTLVFPSTEAPLREVLSVIEIDAPPAEVWPHVVAFSELPPPRSWWFRLGIAYPVRARFDGSGVGAVRHCEFSTGSFVEPVTHWDESERLAFGVESQPPTMEEWSPYRDIEPAHITESLKVERGEFLLIETEGGRTRLEGRTWYRLHLAPQGYWGLWGDQLIHRIHGRVLRHIRTLVEEIPALS